MIKVTIEDDSGSVQILSKKDGDTLPLVEMLQDLVFPALFASGYHPDSMRLLVEGSQLENIL